MTNRCENRRELYMLYMDILLRVCCNLQNVQKLTDHSFGDKLNISIPYNQNDLSKNCPAYQLCTWYKLTSYNYYYGCVHQHFELIYLVPRCNKN